MPVSYSLSESLLEFTFEGSFTTEEARAVFRQGLATVPPGTRPGVLIDVTTSKEPIRRYEAMRRLAQFFGSHMALLSGEVVEVTP